MSEPRIDLPASPPEDAGAPPTLSGPTVSLRPPTREDVPAITSACQDPEIQRWTKIPTPYEEKHAREFISVAERAWRLDRTAVFVVIDRTSGELVGAIDLRRGPHDSEVGEMGYWVRADRRGRGIASEAASLLARWGLSELGLPRIQLFADTRNEASQRVAERAGFRREGVLRSWQRHRDERADYVVFSILPGDVGDRALGDGE